MTKNIEQNMSSNGKASKYKFPVHVEPRIMQYVDVLDRKNTKSLKNLEMLYIIPVFSIQVYEVCHEIHKYLTV